MGAQTSSASAQPEIKKPPTAPMDALHASLKGSADQCPHLQEQPVEKKTYPSECPMSGAVNSDINPLNMMPPANQMPAPDQPFPLSTTRVVSNIPKVSEKDETWVGSIDWMRMIDELFSGLSISTNVLECDVTQGLALAGWRSLIGRYGEHHPNAQHQQRTRLARNLEMGSAACQWMHDASSSLVRWKGEGLFATSSDSTVAWLQTTLWSTRLDCRSMRRTCSM